MSVSHFRKEIQNAEIGKNDLTWFPRWIARYAAGKTLTNGKLPLSEKLVVNFSRSLLESGIPAWQRLQGVRSLEAYRNLVLKSAEPDLSSIKQTLSRLAALEKDAGATNSVEIPDAKLIGIIDPSEPPIIQSMRKEMRVRHLALETERAYISWVTRFARHCGSTDLAAYGEPEIKSFLTELAVEGQVTAGTQDQALAA
jgi:hypothetical protein